MPMWLKPDTSTKCIGYTQKRIFTNEYDHDEQAHHEQTGLDISTPRAGFQQIRHPRSRRQNWHLKCLKEPEPLCHEQSTYSHSHRHRTEGLEIRMDSFLDFHELDEAIGRSNWVKAASVVLANNVRSHGANAIASSDTNQKLDRIARQNNWLAGLMLLNLATTTDDRSLLRGIKGGKR
jgi:hypothetical protein